MKSKKGFKLTKEILPPHATHPGVLIADELQQRGLKQKDLAEKMEIAPTTMSEIIHGKRNLTTDLALKLEMALDVDAAYWMRLQVRYEIDSVRIKKREVASRARNKTTGRDESQLLIK